MNSRHSFDRIPGKGELTFKFVDEVANQQEEKALQIIYAVFFRKKDKDSIDYRNHRSIFFPDVKYLFHKKSIFFFEKRVFCLFLGR